MILKVLSQLIQQQDFKHYYYTIQTPMKNQVEQQLINLLNEFNQYKLTVLKQKELHLQQLQKNRIQMQTLTEKLQKKYTAKLSQERLSHHKKQQKLQKNYQNAFQQFQEHIQLKNNTIKELYEKIAHLQLEKKNIIQMNTNMLQEMAADQQHLEQLRGPTPQSYKQLSKMYQYLLQENNQLKKSLYLSKNNLNNDSLVNTQKKYTGTDQNKSKGLLNKTTKIDKQKKKVTKKSVK